MLKVSLVVRAPWFWTTFGMFLSQSNNSYGPSLNSKKKHRDINIYLFGLCLILVKESMFIFADIILMENVQKTGSNFICKIQQNHIFLEPHEICSIFWHVSQKQLYIAYKLQYKIWVCPIILQALTHQFIELHLEEPHHLIHVEQGRGLVFKRRTDHVIHARLNPENIHPHM